MTGRRRYRPVLADRARLAGAGLAAMLLAALPGQGHGQGLAAGAKGAATAEVVAPTQIVPLSYLRFGSFARPASAGTETVSVASAVSGTGGMAANLSMPQGTGGRGAASFQLNGQPRRIYIVDLPAQATIASGSATMTVSNFTSDTVGIGIGQLDASGRDILTVGGTLNVSANQAAGDYSGTFPLTVYYL